MVGLYPYQTVVLWYPADGTMMALMMVAMLKVGHLNMKSSSITCSLKPLFPLSFNLFSTGMRRGSWMGSGWSLS